MKDQLFAMRLKKIETWETGQVPFVTRFNLQVPLSLEGQECSMERIVGATEWAKDMLEQFKEYVCNWLKLPFLGTEDGWVFALGEPRFVIEESHLDPHKRIMVKMLSLTIQLDLQCNPTKVHPNGEFFQPLLKTLKDKGWLKLTRPTDLASEIWLVMWLKFSMENLLEWGTSCPPAAEPDHWDGILAEIQKLGATFA